MDSTHATRRSVLSAAFVAPILVPSACATPMNLHDGDDAIRAAWSRRQNAYAAYNAIPASSDPAVSDYTPEEARLWAIIDAAEEVIRSSIATTPRGVSIQLWCALYHSVTGREDDEAVTRGDLAALERLDPSLDWTARLALAALRSLQTMKG